MNKVVGSLTLIRTDGYKLWELLFKLSFSDDSPASMAVLRAMLSLAYLYRHGHGNEALRLKVAALNSLSTAMLKENVTGTREIYQHVAVGMLLCAFEVTISLTSATAQGQKVDDFSYFHHRRALSNGRCICLAPRACFIIYAKADILS